MPQTGLVRSLPVALSRPTQPGFQSTMPETLDSFCGLSTTVTRNRLFARRLALMQGVVRYFAIKINTGAASAVTRMGIYEDNGRGYPGRLLFDAGTIDASSTGTKIITTSCRIPAAGLYWGVAVSQGGDPTFEGINVDRDTISRLGVGIAASEGMQVRHGAVVMDNVTGVLPSFFSQTVTFSGNVTAVIAPSVGY